MNQEEKEIKAAEAFKIHQDIIEREKQRRKLFGLNVVDLVQMLDKNFYKLIQGEGAENKWAGYLADIELYYSRAKIRRWQRIIEKLVKDLELEVDSFIDIPETRIDDVVDIIKWREKKEKRKVEIKEVEELLSMARTMIPLDWRNLFRKEQGKETTDECSHQYQVYQICKKCGWRQKVEVDNKQLESELNKEEIQ